MGSMVRADEPATADSAAIPLPKPIARPAAKRSKTPTKPAQTPQATPNASTLADTSKTKPAPPPLPLPTDPQGAFNSTSSSSADNSKPVTTTTPVPVHAASRTTTANAAASVDSPASTRETQLEERLRKMEEMNQRILDRYDDLAKKYDQLSTRLKLAPERAGTKPAARRVPARALDPDEAIGGVARRDADPTLDPELEPLVPEPLDPQPPPEGLISPRREGAGAQGTGGRTNPDERRGGIDDGGGSFTGNRSRSAAEAEQGLSPRSRRGIGAQGTDARTSTREIGSRGEEKIEKVPGKVSFAEGLEITSPDEEFQLTFHDLTQVELRGFPASQQGTLNTQFFIPRQRWYFTGRATKFIEYYTAINRGYGALDMLDAFITFGYDRRWRLRAGRMKTPFSYEYYSIAEGDLIAPERSVYTGNLSGNRQEGLMVLGEFYEGRLSYSTGIFNGARRSFGDYNSSKDLYLYLNSRPFLESKRFSALNYLNLGGTVNGGAQRNPLQPMSYHTANDQTAGNSDAVVSSLSPTFLTYNTNVSELGQRLDYGGFLAWYYKSFNLLAEYHGGYQGFSTDGVHSTTVPFTGWFIQPYYFITGEEITRRVNVVKPKKDFSIENGKITGPGAWEVHARFATMNVGRNVFTSGLVDPNLWSNSAMVTDIGANWYLNFYTKIYFDWQHSEFGSPVVLGPNHFGRTTDLFWLRFQVFF